MMALLVATMAAPTEALLSGMTAVTGEGNSPHTTVWICSFRPCHCMFGLGLHALHAVIFVGSETLHGSSVQLSSLYYWQLSILCYGIMTMPQCAAGL